MFSDPSTRSSRSSSVDSRATERGTRHSGLDGLRGVAVATIIVFHGGVGLPGASLAVDLFLALSGFLITTILLRELGHSGRLDLNYFWGRRLRRLLPALLVMVTSVVVLGTLAGDIDPSTLRGDALATLGYVANWRFTVSDTGYFAAFGAPSPLRHAWTLAVEEQWYLLWPPVLWAMWRLLGRRPMALAGTLLVLAGASAAWAYHLREDIDRVHYGTDTRAQGLLVGAALAVFLHHRPLQDWRPSARRALRVATLPALALMAAAFVLGDVNEPWVHRGGQLAFVLVAAVAVAGSILPGPGRSVLSLAPLCWLGVISYGLYLWHWPVFVWLTPSRIDLPAWPLFALRVSVSLLAAVASARWIERPFRRPDAPRLRYPGRVALASTAGLALFVVVAIAALPRPTTDSALAVSPSLPEGFVVPESPGGAQRTETAGPPPDAVPPRVPAPPDGVLDVAVIGDSTAWTLGYVAPPPGFRIRGGGVIGCGIDPATVLMAGHPVPSQGDPVDCPDARALWEYVVREQQPDVVLMTIGAWEVFDRQLGDGTQLEVGTEEWNRWLAGSLTSVVAQLAEAAPGAVIAIASLPCLDVRDDQLGGSASPRTDPSRIAAVNDHFDSLAAAHSDRVALVPMDEWLCPGGAPIGRVDGVEVRADGVHVNGPGIQVVWDHWLTPWLQSTVPRP